MAVLRTSFSPAFSCTASSSKRPVITTSSFILPVGRQHSFPALKTSDPCPRLALVRAQSGDAGPRASQPPLAGHHFHDEMEQITHHYLDIISSDSGFLYEEATAMLARVCLSANKALIMASRVVDSARLNLGAPSEISAETIHGTVRTYASVFSSAADDSYKKTANKNTVVSFLGALRGLAAVSHILQESALKSLCHGHPRVAVSEYAVNSDLEDMYREFVHGMRDVEDEIRSASAVKTCRLVVPAILACMDLAGYFVRLMLDRRRRALEKAPSETAVV